MIFAGVRQDDMRARPRALSSNGFSRISPMHTHHPAYAQLKKESERKDLIAYLKEATK